MDKGTETGHMATIHAFLMQSHRNENQDQDAAETVQYGPSTSNKVISPNILNIQPFTIKLISIHASINRLKGGGVSCINVLKNFSKGN